MAEFIDQDLSDSRFRGVNLAGSHFQLAQLGDVEFRFCEFGGTRFHIVEMYGVKMRGVELQDVEISGDIGNLKVNGVGPSRISTRAISPDCAIVRDGYFGWLCWHR